MVKARKPVHRALVLGISLLALGACGTVKDWDLRNAGGGFNTSDAPRQATLDRPRPDDRGIISYPGYQVAVARAGDTPASIAGRIGVQPDELARYNGVTATSPLREGEVLALPSRVAEPSPATGAATTGPIMPSNGAIDITTLANGAIDRADSSGTKSASAAPAPGPATPKPQVQTGKQPVRHKVQRGETAYSIARLYNVPAKALADWNGLGPDLSVHEGQNLMIPVTDDSKPVPTAQPPVTAPGQQSPTPLPPSASKPLPPPETPVATPPAPDMSKDRTNASASKYLMPVDGKIITAFDGKNNKGIDIAGAPGTPVKAAADGTVALISNNTDGTPILIIRHADGLLTVYAGLGNSKVSKGSAIKRGQVIGAIAPGNQPHLHFEVVKGADRVDPMPYLQ